MAVAGRRGDAARLAARAVVARIGSEIRIARRAAGLSQGVVARAVGVDASAISRIERGQVSGVSLSRLSMCCTAVGLRLSVRAFPDGDPIRDAGQLRLLERVRARLPPGTGWTTEVPLPIAGDRRAIDAVAVLAGRRVMIEAETRLDDLQALERRLALKLRDADVRVAILVIADTHHNRAVLGRHREALRTLFPLDSRAVLAALHVGRVPSRNGLVIL